MKLFTELKVNEIIRTNTETEEFYIKTYTLNMHSRNGRSNSG